MKYTFEKMMNFKYKYQVRLCGEFVCYSNHTSEDKIDKELKEMGYENKGEFLKDCYEEIRRNTLI